MWTPGRSSRSTTFGWSEILPKWMLTRFQHLLLNFLDLKKLLPSLSSLNFLLLSYHCCLGDKKAKVTVTSFHNEASGFCGGFCARTLLALPSVPAMALSSLLVRILMLTAMMWLSHLCHIRN